MDIGKNIKSLYRTKCDDTNTLIGIIHFFSLKSVRCLQVPSNLSFTLLSVSAAVIRLLETVLSSSVLMSRCQVCLCEGKWDKGSQSVTVGGLLLPGL